MTCGIAGQLWPCLSCPWKPSRTEAGQLFWAVCSCVAPAHACSTTTCIQSQTPRAQLVIFPSDFAIHCCWEESSSMIFATPLWVVSDGCQIFTYFLLWQKAKKANQGKPSPTYSKYLHKLYAVGRLLFHQPSACLSPVSWHPSWTGEPQRGHIIPGVNSLSLNKGR